MDALSNELPAAPLRLPCRDLYYGGRWILANNFDALCTLHFCRMPVYFGTRVQANHILTALSVQVYYQYSHCATFAFRHLHRNGHLYADSPTGLHLYMQSLLEPPIFGLTASLTLPLRTFYGRLKPPDDQWQSLAPCQGNSILPPLNIMGRGCIGDSGTETESYPMTVGHSSLHTRVRCTRLHAPC